MTSFLHVRSSRFLPLCGGRSASAEENATQPAPLPTALGRGSAQLAEVSLPQRAPRHMGQSGDLSPVRRSRPPARDVPEDVAPSKTNSAPRTFSPEIDATAYLFARDITDRITTTEEREALRDANEVVEATRRFFKDGRSNVRPDVAAATTNSWQLKSAVNTVLNGVASAGNITTSMRFGVVAYGQAGGCEQHAYVGAHVYAMLRKLKPQEEISVVGNPDHDHWWCVLTNKATGLCVVMDPWCEGPAILLDESRFMRKAGNQVFLTLTHDDPETAPDPGEAPELVRAIDAVEQFQQGLNDIGPALWPAIDSAHRVIEARGDNCPEDSLWDPEPAISNRFAREITQTVEGKVRHGRHKLQQSRAEVDPHGNLPAMAPLQGDLHARLQTEVLATRVAREDGGRRGVLDVAQAASLIAERAQHLQEPKPRLPAADALIIPRPVPLAKAKSNWFLKAFSSALEVIRLNGSRPADDSNTFTQKTTRGTQSPANMKFSSLFERSSVLHGREQRNCAASPFRRPPHPFSSTHAGFESFFPCF